MLKTSTGAIDSIVVQDPFKMGYESTKAVGLRLNGKEPAAAMQELLFPDIARWLRR